LRACVFVQNFLHALKSLCGNAAMLIILIGLLLSTIEYQCVRMLSTQACKLSHLKSMPFLRKQPKSPEKGLLFMPHPVHVSAKSTYWKLF